MAVIITYVSLDRYDVMIHDQDKIPWVPFITALMTLCVDNPLSTDPWLNACHSSAYTLKLHPLITALMTLCVDNPLSTDPWLNACHSSDQDTIPWTPLMTALMALCVDNPLSTDPWLNACHSSAYTLELHPFCIWPMKFPYSKITELIMNRVGQHHCCRCPGLCWFHKDPCFQDFILWSMKSMWKPSKYLEPGGVTGTLVLFILNLILHLSPSSEVMIQDFM